MQSKVAATSVICAMNPSASKSWLSVDGGGLYCRPGGFHIDPSGAVERAIITHGHSDHARSGHDYVLATRETLGVMETRLGSAAQRGTQALPYGETLQDRRRHGHARARRPRARQRASGDRVEGSPRRHLRRL